MKRRTASMLLALSLVEGLLAAACAAPTAPGKPDPRRQLDGLYRPLLALVVESRESVGAFLKELGRDYIHPLKGDEEARWIRKIETDLLPRNDRMCALIREQRGLVDGDLPDAWQGLLDHQDAWKADHERWKRDGTAYGFRARTPFPRALESLLKKDVARLEASLK